MPIVVNWDDPEKTLLRWDFNGLWDWPQVFTATEQSVRMRQEVEHSVSIILNLERATPLKPGAINHTKTALSFSPEGRDLVVVAGQSVFVQSVVDIFRKMNVSMADKFVGVHSVNEARKLIASRRAETS